MKKIFNKIISRILWIFKINTLIISGKKIMFYGGEDFENKLRDVFNNINRGVQQIYPVDSDIMPNKRGLILDKYFRDGGKINDKIDLGELQDRLTYLFFCNTRRGSNDNKFILDIWNLYIGEFPYMDFVK